VAAARELAAGLRTHPAVAAVRSGSDDDLPRATFALYFPRRNAFLTDEPARIPELLSPEALDRRAARAREELALPTSVLTKRILPEDPIGAFARILERLAALGPGLDLVDGQLMTRDHRFAVLFVTTSPSAFEGSSQRAFLADLDDLVRALPASQDGSLVFEAAGANRFAVAAERSIRADVSLISTLSVAGVVALFLLAFRSLRSLALAGLPVVSGIVTAACASLLVFGHLDGITLGFGAALIGVVIDYPVLLLAHARLGSSGGIAAVVRRVRPGITLGALTTIASFAGLGLTTIPGLRQLAFFSVVGVGAALLVTLFVLPPFVEVESAPRGRVRSAGEVLERIVRAVSRSHGVLAAATFLVLALALAALPRLVWQDDLSKLWRMDPQLQEEDQRVRARVGPMENGRFVVVVGPDAETALERNDAVGLRLERARAEGQLEGFRSLHALLWSRALQEANERGVRAVPDLAARVQDAFTAHGFRADALAPFARTLAAPPAAPLELDTLLASPLGDLAGAMVVPLDPGLALLTQVRGVRDEDALRAALADLPDAHLFDQRRFLAALFGDLRATTLQQIALGNVLVLALVVLRYRRLRPSVAAFLPCVFVTVLELGLFSLAGLELNILHAVGLVLVTGMGVDYSIFVVDAARAREGFDATMLGLALCCLTASCTFGMLALSQQPALRAVGATVGVGVVLSFLCAPLSLLVLGPSAPPGANAAADA
jgi:predicted exporter